MIICDVMFERMGEKGKRERENEFEGVEGEKKRL